MKAGKLFLFLLFSKFLLVNSLFSQNLNTWEAITSFNHVTGIVMTESGQVWGISKGGLFSFEDESFASVYTTIEGMHRLDAVTIDYLPQQNLLILGYTDGMIDLFDLDSRQFERLEDIHRVTAFASKRVNSFFIYDDTFFAATDFGIVMYDISSLLVIDSFSKIGSFDRGTVVEEIVIADGKIYAATQQGVAVGDLQLNLNTSDAWQNYDENDGLPAGGVNSIRVFEERIFASGSEENLLFENDNWQQTDLFGDAVISGYSVSKSGSLLVARSNSSIFLADEQLNITSFSADALQVNDVIYDDLITARIYAGTINQGIGFSLQNQINFTFISPPGPNINFFDGMNFDGSTLYSGSTQTSERNALIDNAKGYHIFKDGVWHSFNRYNTPVLNQFLFRQAFRSAHTDDFYYFGSWGRGIARHHKETNEIHVFNNSNSTIQGWESLNPDFPVITGLESDSEGNVWATSFFGSTPLYFQRPGDDDWVAYEKVSAAGTGDEYVGLFVDSRDQKWVTLQSPGSAGRGLVVIDTGVPDDPEDQHGVKITDEPNEGNLPHPRVNALIEDLDGEIWVGTDRGIARFIFPQFIIDGSAQERQAQWLLNEDPDAESPFLLRDVNVSAMAVNSANQKWIGSVNEGVWLLNERGSRIIKHFNTRNSPILSDGIKDIAIREETGEVYISTEVGLIIYRDIPVEPVREMKTLKVYPNPFVYDRHERIIVEDLSEQTTIRVLGVDGTLIRAIENRGGRAEWNGLDYNGNRVGSGVYLVVALSPNGEERGMGKVVIIR